MQTNRLQHSATARVVQPPAITTRIRLRVATWDRYLLVVLTLAIILSIISLVYAYQHGLMLMYYDSQARLLITRRVVDSPTAGFAQLGGVWLPLTHILAIPFIGNSFLYHTGLALTIFSLVSFVLTAVFLYEILVVLTNDRLTGVIAALIFFSNPNMLYMQSTPMTEMPMYASMIGAVYFFLRLSREPDNRTWYFLSGLAIAISTFIRYEGWMLLAAELPALIYIYIRNKYGWRKIEGLLIYWGYWAFAGVAAWFFWNWLIFGDPLSFQRGEYAKPSLWVSAGDSVIGHLGPSFMTYFDATLWTVGPIFFVGMVGLLFYLWKTRLRGNTIAPLTLLCMFPCFVIMLYLGQRPMKVPEISGYFYNVRFALVMLLPVAIFVAYLTQHRLLPKLLVVVIVAVTGIYSLRAYGIATIEEPTGFVQGNQVKENSGVATWLKQHYDGKPMLIESYGNDQIEFESGISLGNLIYEGSYRLWDKTLAFPQQNAEWVLMRNVYNQNGSFTPADKVWRTLHDSPTFHQDFDLVYKSQTHEIYHKRPKPVLEQSF